MHFTKSISQLMHSKCD